MIASRTARHAQQPSEPAVDLVAECHAAGMAPGGLASLIKGLHPAGQGRLSAPNLAQLIEDIHDDTAIMIRAVSAGKAARSFRGADRTRKVSLKSEWLAAGVRSPESLLHASCCWRAH
jgi:hypothetical protein